MKSFVGNAPRLAALILLVAVAPAYGSIEGVYTGNHVTGKAGGAAFSYIHAPTTAKKSGDANYDQNAGGPVLYAMDSSPNSLAFYFSDPNNNGLDDGDSLTFNNSTIAISAFDGTLNSTNSGAPAGFLTLNGTLEIGGAHSTLSPPDFTHGIRNITAADTDAAFAGLEYTITALDNTTVLNTGEIFFQSGALAGPFNGIKYDAADKRLTFALWGNSLNKGGRESGEDGSGNADPLGFDIFISAQMVPELSSVVTWGLLVSVGLLVRMRVKK